MSIRTSSDSIRTSSDFEEVINQLAQLQTRQRLLEGKRDRDIQRIQEEHSPKIEETEQQIEKLLEEASAYAETHRDELRLTGVQGDSKSAETQLARYGFRIGNPTVKALNRKWSASAILEAVRRVLGREYLHVDEKIAKDKLRTLPAEKLAAVGLRVDQDEAFWVEPKVDGGAVVSTT